MLRFEKQQEMYIQGKTIAKSCLAKCVYQLTERNCKRNITPSDGTAESSRRENEFNRKRISVGKPKGDFELRWYRGTHYHTARWVRIQESVFIWVRGG